ncbi:MAG: hypothetical protein AB7G06_09640 [Bdellovibrionales bacterium]
MAGLPKGVNTKNMLEDLAEWSGGMYSAASYEADKDKVIDGLKGPAALARRWMTAAAEHIESLDPKEAAKLADRAAPILDFAVDTALNRFVDVAGSDATEYDEADKLLDKGTKLFSKAPEKAAAGMTQPVSRHLAAVIGIGAVDGSGSDITSEYAAAIMQRSSGNFLNAGEKPRVILGAVELAIDKVTGQYPEGAECTKASAEVKNMLGHVAPLANDERLGLTLDEIDTLRDNFEKGGSIQSKLENSNGMVKRSTFVPGSMGTTFDYKAPKDYAWRDVASNLHTHGKRLKIDKAVVAAIEADSHGRGAAKMSRNFGPLV